MVRAVLLCGVRGGREERNDRHTGKQRKLKEREKKKLKKYKVIKEKENK